MIDALREAWGRDDHRQSAVQRDRRDRRLRPRASAHGRPDRLHVGGLGAPDRRARGRGPADELYATCAAGARDHDAASTPSAASSPGRSTASPARFARTEGRRDYALDPPGRSYLRGARGRGRAGPQRRARCATSSTASASTTRTRARQRHGDRVDGRRWSRSSSTGSSFANLVDTDQVYGHRKDVAGFHRALQEIDAAVRAWTARARPRARPAGPDRRPRLRPDDARHRPHARARAAARQVRRPRRPAPRRPDGRRRRLGAALARRARRRRAARHAVHREPPRGGGHRSPGRGGGPCRRAFALLALLAAAGCGGGARLRGASPARRIRRSGPGRRAAARRRRARSSRFSRDARGRSSARDVAGFSPHATGGQRASRPPGGASARRGSRSSACSYAADEPRDRGRSRARAMRLAYRVARRDPAVPHVRVARRPQDRRGWRLSRDAARQEPLPWEVARLQGDARAALRALTPPVSRPRRARSRPTRTPYRRDPGRAATAGPAPVACSCSQRAPARQADRLTRAHRPTALIALTDVSGESVGPARTGQARAGSAAARRLARCRRAVRPRAREHARPRAHPRRARAGHVRAHPGVAGRGHGAVRLERRPHGRGAAAGQRRCATLAGRDSISRTLSGASREQAAAYAVRVGRRPAIAARYGARGLLRLYDAFNGSTLRAGGPALRTTDRVLRGRSACRSRELDAAPRVGALLPRWTGDARATRGRDDPPPPGSARRGPGAARLEVLDPRWCRPLGRRGARRRGRGPARRARSHGAASTSSGSSRTTSSCSCTCA